jgi:cyclase
MKGLTGLAWMKFGSNRRTVGAIGIGLFAALLSSRVVAQDQVDVRMELAPVAEGIYVLYGQGGNIGVSVGEDGLLLIDDQFAYMTTKIRTAVATVSDRPVRMVLNTHWHGDHTGGNEALARDGAMIVAHENVRARMNSRHFSTFFNSTSEPSPREALPVVTFDRNVTVHLNGQTIRLEHAPTAHTDGDAIVYFEEANVVHMGDNFFNGLYPFIDADSGGSIVGMVAAIDTALGHINDETQVIPGHGPLSDKQGLRAFRDLLDTVASRMRTAIDAGRSVEDIVASKPTADFDGKWGQGFIEPDDWVALVYGVMTRNASGESQ